MFREFCRYFFRYMFLSKTRHQHLLFLAIGGLIVSSFALLALQSTMGGLQHKLMTRSQNVRGKAILLFRGQDFAAEAKISSLMRDLRRWNLQPVGEYEADLLLRHGSYISPVVAHGVEVTERTTTTPPAFLGLDDSTPLREAILGHDLAMKLHAEEGDSLRLIAPGRVSSFLGDIPRQRTVLLERTIITDVPEVDLYHLWMRLLALQNLLHLPPSSSSLNRIRLYNSPELGWDSLREWLAQAYGPGVELQTWEEQHKTLMWALNLETTVMLFLFIGMTMLVSLCITSGLLIFFDKIRNDLASFWILGASKRSLERAAFLFLNLITFCSVFLGLGLGGIFLFLLDRYGVEVMPDIFVDRKIPIHVTASGVFISFVVPYAIALIFSLISLHQFKRESESSLLEQVRTF